MWWEIYTLIIIFNKWDDTYSNTKTVHSLCLFKTTNIFLLVSFWTNFQGIECCCMCREEKRYIFRFPTWKSLIRASQPSNEQYLVSRLSMIKSSKARVSSQSKKGSIYLFTKMELQPSSILVEIVKTFIKTFI